MATRRRAWRHQAHFRKRPIFRFRPEAVIRTVAVKNVLRVGQRQHPCTKYQVLTALGQLS